MLRKIILALLFTSSLFTSSLYCQESAPFDINRYADISTTEESFTVANVAARMIEGLGFRYYWASIDLKEDDLSYKPSESGRTVMETIAHIHGLSEFMTSFLELVPTRMNEVGNFQALRKATLMNLELIERKLKSMNPDEFNSYQQGQVTFWQLINGPVSDAIWHSGQLVMMRRASGNPLPKGVNVLMGTKN
jgi:hypothetical protein